MTEIAFTALHWLHLVAAAMWIGGIAFVILVARPAVDRVRGADPGALMREMGGKFSPLANICILALVLTGAVLTAAGSGFPGTAPRGAGLVPVLGLKILLAAIMISIHIFRGMVLPGMISHAADERRRSSLGRLSVNLVRLNLGLGCVILLLSAAHAHY